MKKILLALLLGATSICARSQSFSVNFDDSSYTSVVFIDTVNYHRNNWQIATPNKTVFDSAYSTPNVIVTNTSHPYSSNDTSVFILRAVKYPYLTLMPFVYSLSFWYQLDIDSNATASIEFSGDNGLTWTNILKDTTTFYQWWSGSKPNLDTSTKGWKWVGVGSFSFKDGSADTTLFRFTFVSGSNDSGKDGWMIDNMEVDYYSEGLVHSVGNNLSISLFPNPAGTNLTISTSDRITVIEITNLIGQSLYSNQYNSEKVQIDVSNLPSGVYLIRINGTEVRKFIKQ